MYDVFARQTFENGKWKYFNKEMLWKSKWTPIEIQQFRSYSKLISFELPGKSNSSFDVWAVEHSWAIIECECLVKMICGLKPTLAILIVPNKHWHSKLISISIA